MYLYTPAGLSHTFLILPKHNKRSNLTTHAQRTRHCKLLRSLPRSNRIYLPQLSQNTSQSKTLTHDVSKPQRGKKRERARWTPRVNSARAKHDAWRRGVFRLTRVSHCRVRAPVTAFGERYNRCPKISAGGCGNADDEEQTSEIQSSFVLAIMGRGEEKREDTSAVLFFSRRLRVSVRVCLVRVGENWLL